MDPGWGLEPGPTQDLGYFPAVPRGWTDRKFEDNCMIRWSFVTGKGQEHRQP